MALMAWKPAKSVDDDFYTLADGSRRLRVTRVIGAMEKEALGPWYARLAAECAWAERTTLATLDEATFVAHVKEAAARYTKKAADLGTEVHDAIEGVVNGWLAGEEYPEPEAFPKALQGHLRGFLAWCREYEPQWVAAEFKVFDSVVMGTCDAAAFVDLGNGKGTQLTILDFKTGKSVHAEAVSLQLATYRHLPHAVMNGKQVANLDYAQGAVLHVRPRSMNMYEVECGEREYHVYRHAFEVWKHLNLRADTLLGPRISVER